MATLLETIGIVLETHFRFEFPNESPVANSLTILIVVYIGMNLEYIYIA